MTRRAVVFYEVDATDAQKARALAEGIQECVGELVDLGWDMGRIEETLTDAENFAEWCIEDRDGITEDVDQ